MNKMHKVIILFFGAFALFGVAKEWVYKNDKNVIIVDGHYVSKTPCMGAMNQVYGRGIDSVKICDCMIPKFYELIKNDPSQIKKFEEMGIFTLEGPLYDSTTKMFEYCASHSILDSNYKLPMNQFLKSTMIDKFRKQFDETPGTENIDFDEYIKCAFENLDGKITIAEFLSADMLEIGWIKNQFLSCLAQSKK